ncbi:MAG: hypothetical protein IT557_10055 [Alphaproteobacteria bacterium]|nr:hypothetical protein [Alphaproteobacteria bacterium]
MTSRRARLSPPVPAAAALLLGAALLAGCGDSPVVRSQETVFGQSGTPIVRRELAIPRCPEVAILGDAADITRFGQRGGTDLTNVTIDGRISAVNGRCDGTRQGLTVDLSMTLEFERGPAAQGRAESVPYFVAITDQQQNILSKQVFMARAEFPRGQNRVRLTDEGARMLLPVTAERPSWNYAILVGFQLDEAELAYNRRRGPR